MRRDPRKTFILDKGLYNKPGEEVTATTPANLPTLPEARRGIALALHNGSSQRKIRSPRA